MANKEKSFAKNQKKQKGKFKKAGKQPTEYQRTRDEEKRKTHRKRKAVE